MSKGRPVRESVRYIQGDTLAYSFTFLEDGQELNLSDKEEITVVLRSGKNIVFQHNKADLTIEGGKLSGIATSEQMDVSVRSYDLIIFFDNDIRQTWVMFDVKIFNEKGRDHSSPSEWTISIDTETGTAIGQASKVVVNPNGIILVDGRYNQNTGSTFDDIDLALTAARAWLSDGYSKVTVKAYLDSNNQPIGLPLHENYYDLQEEGIYFESDFDPWSRYVTTGGNFDANELLYTVDFNEIVLTIDPN